MSGGSFGVRAILFVVLNDSRHKVSAVCDAGRASTSDDELSASPPSAFGDFEALAAAED